eukprot:m.115394 g.115394  ORF g.115394 m.115394 type:complete len:176 (-) comp9474_c0_seq10:50-577(-)
MADVETSAEYSAKGILFISFALAADAVIGNYQEKTMKKFNCSNTEMVYFSYSIGFVYTFLVCVLNGELDGGMNVVRSAPMSQTLTPIVSFSFAGYLGISFVLNLVKTFGALTAVTVTNCRKIVTMIVSFMAYPKPFSYQYLLGGLLVLIGIGLNVYSKNRGQRIFLPQQPRQSIV